MSRIERTQGRRENTTSEQKLSTAIQPEFPAITLENAEANIHTLRIAEQNTSMSRGDILVEITGLHGPHRVRVVVETSDAQTLRDGVEAERPHGARVGRGPENKANPLITRCCFARVLAVRKIQIFQRKTSVPLKPECAAISC
jgi:hypothetical protein